VWVVKVKGYSGAPEEEAMKILEGYIISASNRYHVEGFDAEDIAQELRLHLWKKLHLYNPTIGTIETWGYRVISNKVRDLSRRRDPLCSPHSSYEDIIKNEK